MRVVSGQFRGRRLVSPEGRDTRPTTEKVREAVFNALGSLDLVDDAEGIDLGPGAINSWLMSTLGSVVVNDPLDVRGAISNDGYLSSLQVLPGQRDTRPGMAVPCAFPGSHRPVRTRRHSLSTWTASRSTATSTSSTRSP